MCSNLFLIIKKLEESFLFLVIHYLWEIQTEPSVLFFIAVCFYIITDQQLRLQKDTKKAVYVCVFVFIHAQPLIIFWLLSSPIYLATVLYFTKLKNLQTFNSQKKKKKHYGYASAAQREPQWSINRSKQWFFQSESGSDNIYILLEKFEYYPNSINYLLLMKNEVLFRLFRSEMVGYPLSNRYDHP